MLLVGAMVGGAVVMLSSVILGAAFVGNDKDNYPLRKERPSDTRDRN